MFNVYNLKENNISRRLCRFNTHMYYVYVIDFAQYLLSLSYIMLILHVRYVSVNACQLLAHSSDKCSKFCFDEYEVFALMHDIKLFLNISATKK